MLVQPFIQIIRVLYHSLAIWPPRHEDQNYNNRVRILTDSMTTCLIFSWVQVPTLLGALKITTIPTCQSLRMPDVVQVVSREHPNSHEDPVSCFLIFCLVSFIHDLAFIINIFLSFP